MSENVPTPVPAAEPQIAVRDLPEGERVRSYYLCTERVVSTTRTGSTMMRLTLRDASGEVKGVHFDADPGLAARLVSGDVVKVEGTYAASGQYGPQFKVDRMRIMEEGEYDPATLIAVSPIDIDELERRLHSLVNEVANPALRDLLEHAFAADGGLMPTFRVAPAAVTHHHAYRHGLLEHAVIVGEVAAGVAAHFAGVSRDLVIAGALLHDVGKTEAYSADLLNPGFTDAGRLHGEIVLGHEIVRRLIDDVPGFPEDVASQLRHIVIAHHGEIEKGSPVVPQTREAIVVHYCDDMTARVGAFDEIERNTPEGDRWSAFNRMLSTRVYLPPRNGDVE